MTRIAEKLNLAYHGCKESEKPELFADIEQWLQEMDDRSGARPPVTHTGRGRCIHNVPICGECQINHVLLHVSDIERVRNETALAATPPDTPVVAKHLVTENPFEQIVERALLRAGHSYVTDHGGDSPARLDFYLPAADVHIEVKTMHSDRVAEQMSRADNVIVAQGRVAIEWLAAQINPAAIITRNLAATMNELKTAKEFIAEHVGVEPEIERDPKEVD